MPRWSALILILSSVPALAQFIPNRYILILEDPPVASRFASRDELRNAPAVAYGQQIDQKQAAVVRDLQTRNIKVTGSVSTLLNAVFVTATPDQLAAAQSVPGVIGTVPMRRHKLSMNKATQLMNAPAAWTLVGGQGNAGKGIKIAILDTGIDQTHPAFQDSSLTMPAGFPKCTDGHPEDCAYTNSKVIVARSYVRDLALSAVTDPNNPAAQSIPDDYSPRDRQGHGTATASVAAGNTSTGTVTFTGMAPKAYLGNYKLSGSPGVNDSTSDDIMIKAVEDALKDGMDIVSLSIGSIALSGALDTGAACGLAAGAACDPLAAAYEAAAKAGLVICVAAGNDGENGSQYPYFDSISTPATAPSVIAAGASTNSHVFVTSASVIATNAPASLKGIAAQLADSTFAPSTSGANSAPLVDVTTLGNDGLGCTALPAGSLTNQYALIQRGTCDFGTKAGNAQQAGAVGVIFYMADSSAPTGITLNGLFFLGPVVMISNSDGVALKAYIDSNPGQAVTIDLAGIEQDLPTYSQLNGISPALASNQLASYSSFGPAPDGSLKPDMVAIGGFDPFAAAPGLYVAAQSYDPNGDLYSTNRYAAADGTSFSSPMIAGAAALVKQAHPTYTAAQIKSALVNSAAQDIIVDDFGDPVDIEWKGAGRLDAGAATASTVTAEPSTISFGFVKSGVLPISKTITIRGNSAPLTATVTPKTLTAGATVAASLTGSTLTVTLSGTVPPAGSYSGVVTLQGSGATLRLPYLFLVGDGVPFNVIPLFGDLQGVPGADGGSVAIHVVDQFGVPVAGAPATFSVSPRGSVTFKSVAGKPACSPASSTTTTTCNTDNYGVAYAEVFMGPQTGIETITARAAGQPFQGSVFILPQPVIKAANGVVNAANFQAPIAPGSYITIFGSDMVDPDVLNNPTGDLATTAILPLSLDAVSVSFDVPSKGISVPGYLTFVSPTQINLQVPWELQGQSSAQVKVIMDEFFGIPFFGTVVTVPLSDYTPAFFEGGGVVAARDPQGVQIFTNHAAIRGQAISLYGNGFGPVTNRPNSGDPAPSVPPLAQTTTTPVVMIGGQQAQVLFSGLAPGTAGEYQINVIVPAGLSPGNQPITVAIGGQTSKASNLPVQ